ncbi:hypothetical protein D3C81_2166730 [compost metagenome]
MAVLVHPDLPLRVSSDNAHQNFTGLNRWLHQQYGSRLAGFGDLEGAVCGDCPGDLDLTGRQVYVFDG